MNAPAISGDAFVRIQRLDLDFGRFAADAGIPAPSPGTDARTAIHESIRQPREEDDMRHEGMRDENENVAQTTASDLRAVAEDMLRMGRHWARAAQGWLERAGDEAQRQASRMRSDRDLQSDYSTGGYDQVDTAGAYYGYGHGAETYPGGRDFGGRDYRGVGPRNYTRSDDRIREDLNERLTEAYDLDASGLTVEVQDGVATLGGSVPQRWMKHRAEDLADACIGVRDVHNHILVGSGASATSDRGTTTGTAGTTTGYAGSTGKETP
jgi:osmotically-inducible protein OsmY